MVVITSDERDVILDAVRRMYTDLAREPDRGFHFPTGRPACEFEGYDPEHLDRLPDAALDSFAGVGCPFRAEAIREGDTVLDVGSGSGTDALIASLLVGPEGEVIGLDMTRAMRERLEPNARAGGRLQVADIVLAETPSEACRSKPELWAECIVGATREDEYLDHFREAGFHDVEVLSRLDYFSRSPSEETREVAASFGAEGIVLKGRKA